MAKLEENQSEKPPEPTPTEARQGEPALSPWRALRWGLLLAGVVLLAILLYFVIGSPNG